jgi:DNA polymerase III subunit gamma/tau
MADPDLNDPESDAAAPDADAPERDPNTVDIFGDLAPAAPAPKAMTSASAAGAAPAESGAYTVLARKYRPMAFEDLIGQEAMVRTLTNAFATGRIAHGFMLTGVRGVGKTTTARLLARALNYETDSVHQPSMDFSVEGRHDRAIIDGRHIDVMELDAASRTKVDEMRELLDGVRYAPVEARYKVYIIDEVHMLSTAAFNALLKTLEEPPPHAKFIFATTEIRKVPVTILSRTQRFDLRRVEPAVLTEHFARVAQAEGFRIEREALEMIARAAEGSVRDGLSLLDQALVQGEPGAMITAGDVRDMLGLADRGETIGLFESVMRGSPGEAIRAFKDLWAKGADPGVVMLDLLDHCHAASLTKAVSPDALGLPSDQAGRLAAVGASVSAGTLSRLWQMLLKGHEEVRRAPDAAAAAEMALIRLCYAADLPGPEEALKALREGAPVLGGPGASAPSGGGGGGASAALAPRQMASPAPQAAPVLASFEDVVRLIDARREVGLKLDVERYMRPISFRPGAITFEPAPGAPSNLAGRLVARLKEWTGQPWLVAAEGGGGGETLLDREHRERAEARAAAAADPFVTSVMTAFPGAELVEVRPTAVPTPDEAPDGAGDDEEE